VSDLYSLWVFICAIKSSDFSEWHLLWCPISTGSECWFWNLFYFANQCPLWCLISTNSECKLYWLCFQPHFLFLTTSAGGMWHALLLFTALCIIISVSHWLFWSCWFAVCEFATKVTHSSILVHWFFTSLYIQNSNVDFCIRALEQFFPSLVCKPRIQC